MIELVDVLELRDPILIAAFEGWNDAGEAATSTVAHLADVWNAELIAQIDPEDYYDFQVNRPRVSSDGGLRRIEWPVTRVLACTDTLIGPDILLVAGIEPSTRWRSFTAEVLEYAQALGVTQVIVLGALLADVPHSRPLPVSSTSGDPALQRAHEIEESTYEGPTGIVGILAEAATTAGIPTLSCWVAVPHYAGGAPSPKAALGLISRLESHLKVTIPRGDLEEDSRAWERDVNELAESDEDVAEYVTSLEQQTDTVDLPEASGDAIAREFEQYLRRRGEDDPPAPR